MRRICCVCVKLRSRNGGEGRQPGKGLKLARSYCPKCYREVQSTIPVDAYFERYRKSFN